MADKYIYRRKGHSGLQTGKYKNSICYSEKENGNSMSFFFVDTKIVVGESFSIWQIRFKIVMANGSIYCYFISYEILFHELHHSFFFLNTRQLQMLALEDPIETVAFNCGYEFWNEVSSLWTLITSDFVQYLDIPEQFYFENYDIIALKWKKGGAGGGDEEEAFSTTSYLILFDFNLFLALSQLKRSTSTKRIRN